MPNVHPIPTSLQLAHQRRVRTTPRLPLGDRTDYGVGYHLHAAAGSDASLWPARKLGPCEGEQAAVIDHVIRHRDQLAA